MKKLFSIVLVLAFVISLAACGVSNTLTEEKLKGTWSFDLKFSAISDLVSDSLGASMGVNDITPFLDTIPDDLAVSVYLIFDGDGNLSAMLKKQDINDFYTGVINALLTEDTMYAIFEAQGMDKETVDTALDVQGLTLSDLISATKQQLSDMNIAESMSGADNTIAKGDYLIMAEAESYTIDGNKVISEDTVLEYDGTNLVINEITSESESAAIFTAMLPLTVKKVNDKTDY
jgi:hypothetical protein